MSVARLTFVGSILFVILLVFSGASVAQDNPAANPVDLGNNEIYDKSLRALTMFFVVAILLESAFAVLFNWRVFLTYFDMRGVRTLVMIVASLFIVNTFKLDILASLIEAYTPDSDVESGPTSKFVSALILSGGSAGVHRIMRALGYRTDDRSKKISPGPKEAEAWVSVRILGDRRQLKEAIPNAQVMIREFGDPDSNSPAPVAGSITFEKPRLSVMFFSTWNRFPRTGGYKVMPNKVYKISVAAIGKDDLKYTAGGLEESYVFADRAIVDLDVRLIKKEPPSEKQGPPPQKKE